MRSILLCILCCPLFTFAQLRVAPVFSDNMILQRDQPIAIFGKAAPNHNVQVVFDGVQKTVMSRSDSTWRVQFPAKKESPQSHVLSVRCGSDSIAYHNILMGDIWVCIGQSNMEFPMRREQHWEREQNRLQHPTIRLMNPLPAGRNVYGVPYTDSIIGRLNTTDFYRWDTWTSCDSTTVKDMSAVAYYFARTVNDQTNIPIGIINLSIGGAPLETFISTTALQQHPIFKSKVQGNWLFNEALPIWVRERGRQNVGDNKNIPQDDMGPLHAYKPGMAYDAGIKPLLQIPVKGLLCYQGESNAQEVERVAEYNRLMKLMVDDYRTKWKQPNMPFYFVQLSSIDTARYKSQLWPEFRNHQRKAMDILSYTGMAVSSDRGFKNDVHPANKKDIGERLARWALCQTYHQSIVASGPLPLKAIYSMGHVLVSFSYAAKGLKTSDGAEVRGFSIDGKTDIDAKIKDGFIEIKVDEKPSFIYYGWKPFSDGNLVNTENLPASTFKITVRYIK